MWISGPSLLHPSFKIKEIEMLDSATKDTFTDGMNADGWKERDSWAHCNTGIFYVDL